MKAICEKCRKRFRCKYTCPEVSQILADLEVRTMSDTILGSVWQEDLSIFQCYIPKQRPFYLRNVSLQDTAILVLRYILGWPVKDIAAVLKMKSRRVYYVLAKLKKKIPAPD